MSGVSALLSFTTLLAFENPTSYRNPTATAGPSWGAAGRLGVPGDPRGPWPLTGGLARATPRAWRTRGSGRFPTDMSSCKVPQMALGICS